MKALTFQLKDSYRQEWLARSLGCFLALRVQKNRPDSRIVLSALKLDSSWGMLSDLNIVGMTSVYIKCYIFCSQIPSLASSKSDVHMYQMYTLSYTHHMCNSPIRRSCSSRSDYNARTPYIWECLRLYEGIKCEAWLAVNHEQWVAHIKPWSSMRSNVYCSMENDTHSWKDRTCGYSWYRLKLI